MPFSMGSEMAVDARQSMRNTGMGTVNSNDGVTMEED
jgi:hypothetical protein